MTDQGLSIFDEQSGKGSPDDKTQVIPVASRGGQEAPQAPAGGSGGAQRPVVPPATRPTSAPATGGAAPGGFPVVRRGGYDPSAVDSRVRQLLGEKTGLAQSLTESETRVLELEAELERVRTEVAEMERPSYAGLGGRASAMLRLAEEEAADVRAAARRDADEILNQAERDAKAIKADAAREAEDMRMVQLQELEEHRTRLLTDAEQERSLARSEAEDLRASAQREADQVKLAAQQEAT